MSFRGPKGYTFGAVLGPERVLEKTPEWTLLVGGKAGKRFVFLMFSRSADVSKASPNGIKTVPKMEPKRGPKWSHKQAQKGGRNWFLKGPKHLSK